MSASRRPLLAAQPGLTVSPGTRHLVDYPFLVQLGRNELHGRSFRNLVCRPAACRYPLRKVMLVPLVAWFTPNLTVHRPPQSELGRSRLGSTVRFTIPPSSLSFTRWPRWVSTGWSICVARSRKFSPKWSRIRLRPPVGATPPGGATSAVSSLLLPGAAWLSTTC